MSSAIRPGVVEPVVPHPVLQPRTPHDRLLHATRWVLLAVLTFAVFAVTVNGEPAPRPVRDLYAGLRAGTVTQVVADRSWPGYGQLLWSEGPTRWSRAIGVPKGEVWDPVTTRLDEARLAPVRASHLAAIAAAGREGGRVVPVTDPPGGPGLWAYAELQRVWAPLAPLGAAAGALTLLLMLGLPERRYATRWAWLWIFLRGGIVFYVLLEPYPLWRRPYDVLTPRGPLNAAQGLLVAIVATFLLVMVPL
ncbi:hypothetical protein Misp01_63150 [Microtetraspora sp. NBRC 13810]|uniref:hypothetical protein n=1 Tax=Microtetraspora sp. NBRC 13810 TaxID=3030990 RepID=UPI0024A1C88E|nr:hypothetical protein [Microtetraspora sp. NBRC 13810]GLW11187.1 hypothetical protein Misp01_63150 [Microtetraspora sp. NBRC 13810]